MLSRKGRVGAHGKQEGCVLKLAVGVYSDCDILAKTRRMQGTGHVHVFKDSIVGTGSGRALGQGCAWCVLSNEASLRRASEAVRSEADNKGAD